MNTEMKRLAIQREEDLVARLRKASERNYPAVVAELLEEAANKIEKLEEDYDLLWFDSVD